MFKRHNRHPSALQIDTLIGAGTRSAGDIEFSGGLHIDGCVQGNVVAKPGAAATLSISDSGSVEGSVSAPHVLLNGRVQGDIVAEQRVQLGGTAKIAGSVYYGLIEMAMGAQINGRLIHVARAESAAPATQADADAPLVAASGAAQGTAGSEFG